MMLRIYQTNNFRLNDTQRNPLLKHTSPPLPKNWLLQELSKNILQSFTSSPNQLNNNSLKMKARVKDMVKGEGYFLIIRNS